MQSQATATFTECLGSVHVLFQMLSNLLNRKHLEDTSTEYHRNSHRHNVPISVVRLPPCGDSPIDSDNPQSLKPPTRHNFQKTIRIARGIV